MSQPQRFSQVRPAAAHLSVRRSLRARPIFIVAFALAGAAGAGWWVWQTRLQLRELHSAQARLALGVAALTDTLSLLRNPGTRVLQIPVSTNGRAGAVTIFADSVSHRWLVSLSGLTPNEPDRAYQLWLLTTAGPRSAALLPITTDRAITVTLAVPAEQGVVTTGVALSIEPRAGAAAPAGPMVFRVTL